MSLRHTDGEGSIKTPDSRSQQRAIERSRMISKTTRPDTSGESNE